MTIATNAEVPTIEPRSVHTSNMARLLSELHSSLLISTYQTGHLVLIRSDGNTCNTHFCRSSEPMGVAHGPAGLAVGLADSVCFRRNVPAGAGPAGSGGRHDACFVPRTVHVTGFINVHEMAWGARDELWLVNTRFSCLATVDYEHSFRPRWRPPFISAYAPEDRCHLNGLAVVSGRPRFVTALGATDAPAGWREDKAHGGVVVDVDSNAVLLQGLSMPHSPRWHDGALWLLESGKGALVCADLEHGTWRTVAELPGFTRGLAMHGPLAFIGLSKVRESAMFGGIPIVNHLQERTCGVWVVDIRSGDTVAFLRFEEGVEEIFSVEFLSGIQSPEILEVDDPRRGSTFVVPDEALATVPPELRSDVPTASAGGPAPDPDGDFMEVYRRGLEARLNGHRDKARAAFEHCLAVRPEQPDVLNDMGALLYQSDEIHPARSCFERAIAGRPDFALAHLNLGLALLKMGEYDRGWREFEWRWRTPACTPLECAQPLWDGGDIHHLTLLVHTEQGAGDVFHFARYLTRAAARCRRLMVVAPENLHPLLSGIPGVDEVRAEGPLAASSFDVYCPLLDLPSRLGVTGPEPPDRLPYLRPASPAAGTDVGSEGLRVGLVWAGSSTHGDDRFRSMDLEVLEPLLGIPGVLFVNLQIGPKRSQLQRLQPPTPVMDPGEAIHGWDRTAGVIDQLDLVIGVDTAAVHLAGALGRPAWVLLARGCDWRWGSSGSTTPWYPSMRLFRQRNLGDWEPVVREVTTRLRELGHYGSTVVQAP